MRTLATENKKGLATIHDQIREELEALPSNEYITTKYCSRNRWCGVLLVDAKYVKVKGYEKKIAFIETVQKIL